MRRRSIEDRERRSLAAGWKNEKGGNVTGSSRYGELGSSGNSKSGKECIGLNVSGTWEGVV